MQDGAAMYAKQNSTDEQIVECNRGVLEIIESHLGRCYASWPKEKVPLDDWMRSSFRQVTDRDDVVSAVRACFSDLRDYWDGREANLRNGLLGKPTMSLMVTHVGDLPNAAARLGLYVDHLVVMDESPIRAAVDFPASFQVGEQLAQLLPFLRLRSLLVPASGPPLIVIAPEYIMRIRDFDLARAAACRVFCLITGMVFPSYEQLVWHLYKTGTVDALSKQVLFPENIPDFAHRCLPSDRLENWHAITWATHLTHVLRSQVRSLGELPTDHPIFLLLVLEYYLGQALGLAHRANTVGAEVAADPHTWEMLRTCYETAGERLETSGYKEMAAASMTDEISWMESIDLEEVARLRSDESLIEVRSRFLAALRRFRDVEGGDARTAADALRLELQDAFREFNRERDRLKARRTSERTWSIGGAIMTGTIAVCSLWVPAAAVVAALAGGASLYGWLRSELDMRHEEANLVRSPIGILFAASQGGKH